MNERDKLQIICDDCGWVGIIGDLEALPDPRWPSGHSGSSHIRVCPQCEGLRGTWHTINPQPKSPPQA
jgi:hypothetical protein